MRLVKYPPGQAASSMNLPSQVLGRVTLLMNYNLRYMTLTVHNSRTSCVESFVSKYFHTCFLAFILDPILCHPMAPVQAAALALLNPAFSLALFIDAMPLSPKLEFLCSHQSSCFGFINIQLFHWFSCGCHNHTKARRGMPHIYSR